MRLVVALVGVVAVVVTLALILKFQRVPIASGAHGIRWASRDKQPRLFYFVTALILYVEVATGVAIWLQLK